MIGSSTPSNAPMNGVLRIADASFLRTGIQTLRDGTQKEVSSHLPKESLSLTQKLEALWKKISSLSQCCPTGRKLTLNKKKESPLYQNLQYQISLVRSKESNYQDILANSPSSDWLVKSARTARAWSFKYAYAIAIKNITAAKVDPTHLPREVALQLVEILWLNGLLLYANKEAPHPFQSAMDVFKTAIPMLEYALGLYETCPDLSDAKNIEDLYSLEHLRRNHSDLANDTIQRMNANQWAEKAVNLKEEELLYIPQLLRYTKGAMDYLEQNDLVQSQHLLSTAEACLHKAQENPTFDQREVSNQLAELIYNNLTGFAAEQAKYYEKEGQHEKAQEFWAKIENYWSECVKLSSEPAKMLARCYNKRTFIKELTPQENLALRKLAVEAHLALPKEQQNSVLIALAWNNLSHAQEEVGDFYSAVEAVMQANAKAKECQARGESDVQLTYVFDNVKRIEEKLADQKKD